MRAGLSSVCPDCAIRVASGTAACPRCGGALASVAAAVPQRPHIRPVRDALLYAPALLAHPVGLAFAVYMTVPLPPAETVLLRVVIAILSLGLGYVAGIVIAGIAWSGWAAIVFGATAFTRPTPLLVRPAPFVSPSRWRRVVEWIVGARWWIAGASFVAVVAIALAIHLENGGPSSSVAFEVLGQALVFGLLVVPLAIAGVITSQHVALLARVRAYALHRRAARVPAALGRARRALCAGRGNVTGPVVRSGPGLIAPLSGAPCVAVRMVGRCGPLVIDDAASVPFVVGGEARVVVRGDAVVHLAPGPITPVRDLNARERALAWLDERGLAELDGGVLELAEAYLVEGDVARVFGAESQEAAASEGYRDARPRRVIDDSDGRPILIERG